MSMYQKESYEVFKELNSSLNGLTSEQVKVNKEKYGANEMASSKPKSTLRIFLEQYQDLLVIILIIAGVISAISGEVVSSIVIYVVITMNAILGTVQTIKARKSLDSLKKLSMPHVKVIRDGKLQEIPSSELVAGDVVSIEAGDVVAGDGRIFEANNLQINESALTGESLPQDKFTKSIEEECGLGDQKNVAFSTSLVTNGTGKYVVYAVGMSTEIGKIATMLENAEERQTPLQENLDEFSKKLTISICVLCAIILVVNVFIAHEDLLDALLIAVALAVAAIPEALGSIVTIVLSISTQKMVKENAIIKELNAAESLGCVSVICSDKTGTLTQNKMTVTDLFLNLEPTSIESLDANEYSHDVLLKSCVLCNNAFVDEESSIGDPTEIALIDLFNNYVSKHPEYVIEAIRQEELPFDSDRKLMSITSKNHVYTKGAVDELLLRCDKVLVHNEKLDITDEMKEKILSMNESYAKQGLRVLGFAYKQIDSDDFTFDAENHLIFVGVVAQMDPPRVESHDAVLECKKAGIKPIMITGDHVVTARAIASKIGIFEDGDVCLEGRKLQKMSDEELQEILPKVSVYARVSPEHKIRIVKAWQKRGEIVAMTGDGVNDAPALKQSDIGVAMGITGTEVSKDASSMILMDDNFSTIVKAVKTGRNLYNNIKHAIIYLLSGNFSAILVVITASLLFLPDPFLPVHLLFINLVTDSLPAIAIGMEGENPDVMKDKPRKKSDSILNKDTLLKICIEGVVIYIFVFMAYKIGLKTSDLMGSTLAFSTLCLSRLFHGFSSRGSKALYHLPFNKYSLMAFVVGFIFLTCILVIPGLHGFFSVASVQMSDLLTILGCAFGSFVCIQILKIVQEQIDKK